MKISPFFNTTLRKFWTQGKGYCTNSTLNSAYSHTSSVEDLKEGGLETHLHGDESVLDGEKTSYPALGLLQGLLQRGGGGG